MGKVLQGARTMTPTKVPTKADVFQKAGDWLAEYFREMIMLLEVVREDHGVPMRVRNVGEWNRDVICKRESITELMKFCFAFYYFPKQFGHFDGGNL